MNYALKATVGSSVDDAEAQVRAAVAENGLGVLTYVDMQATLLEKTGVDIGPHRILGACRPPLAADALAVDPDVGILLPCSVAIYGRGDRSTVVAQDPVTLIEMTDNPALLPIAVEAKKRMVAALELLQA